MDKEVYRLSQEELAKEFDTDLKKGLSQEEAKRRLERDGLNQLEEAEKTTLWQKFINQFKDFMIIVLLVAAFVSFIMGMAEGEGPADAIIILAVVIINAIMGVFQESKAEDAIDALKEMASPEARVIRDGQIHVIKSHDLVVGDLVLLEAGDVVPADLRLTDTNSLQIEEAALTGESVPSEKNTETIDEEVGIGDRANQAFSSTNVTYGRGEGIVTQVAMDTEVGKIADMLASTEKQMTPLQRDQDRLGKVLTVAIICIAVVTFIVGTFFKGFPWIQMLMTAISLAVAAIPEGLPAITTIILSQGTRKMAERNALVRTLPAVETLGGVEVICSDKTGTLTLNQMTVEQVYENGELKPASSEFEQDNSLIRSITYANDAQVGADGNVVGDPTEVAMIEFAVDRNFPLREYLTRNPRVAEVPFDSTRKMMSTIHDRADGSYIVAVKGAPDKLLDKCTHIIIDGEERLMTDDDRKKALAANETMSKQALRVLAGAYKIIDEIPEEVNSQNVECDLVFNGLVGLIDPERKEAADSIAQAKAAGIRTVMITGDHALTAQAIAERLHILEPGVDNSSHVMTGERLDKMSDEELAEKVADYSVYARVSPEHKVRIIRAWQANGKVVSMTGDGVNDAPSLKQADIGVGMGITGTEVSKGASDMVLADDNFATIVAAVEEGRKVFANIQKAVQFLLSANLGEVLTLFIGTLFGWTILEPAHLLWINVVTDVFPAIALGFEDAEPDIMKRKPRGRSSNFLSNGVGLSIIYQGTLEGIITLFVFWYSHYKMGESLIVSETMAFATLGLIQLFHTYNVKSVFSSLFSRNPFDNKHLNGACLLSGSLLFAIIYIPKVNDWFGVTPLDAKHLGVVLLASFTLIVLVEIFKWIFRTTGIAAKYQHIVED